MTGRGATTHAATEAQARDGWTVPSASRRLAHGLAGVSVGKGTDPVELMMVIVSAPNRCRSTRRARGVSGERKTITRGPSVTKWIPVS